MNRSDITSEITDADLLAALMPNSPADLMPADQPSAAPAPVAAPTVPNVPLTVAYQQRPDGTLVPFYTAPAPVPVHQSTHVDSGPLVPRWVVGAAVSSLGVGGGAYFLARALDLLGAAASAIAAGASAALPWLALAGLAIASVVARKKATGKGGVSVVQTITQTITQTVNMGD